MDSSGNCGAYYNNQTWTVGLDFAPDDTVCKCVCLKNAGSTGGKLLKVWVSSVSQNQADFWWESPGVEEHSFTVTKVRPGCGHPDLGEGDDGHSLLLLYVVRNEGNVPLKIESVDIDTPWWIEFVRYRCHVPNESREEAMFAIEASSDIPRDAKQALIDSIRAGRQQECILELGPESHPNTWGLIHIWLHITRDAPENTPDAVTVSPVFKIWRGD